MNTTQIKKALTQHPFTKHLFKGVFPRDKIPRIPKNKVLSFIFNTDPSDKPGKHWVAFHLTRNTVFYFDSYGLPPYGFGKILRSRPKRKYFARRLQGNGQECGHYCLFFLLNICQGKKKPFQMFGKDLNVNDRIVKKYVEKHFCGFV